MAEAPPLVARATLDIDPFVRELGKLRTIVQSFTKGVQGDMAGIARSIAQPLRDATTATKALAGEAVAASKSVTQQAAKDAADRQRMFTQSILAQGRAADKGAQQVARAEEAQSKVRKEIRDRDFRETIAAQKITRQNVLDNLKFEGEQTGKFRKEEAARRTREQRLGQGARAQAQAPQAAREAFGADLTKAADAQNSRRLENERKFHNRMRAETDAFHAKDIGAEGKYLADLERIGNAHVANIDRQNERLKKQIDQRSQARRSGLDQDLDLMRRQNAIFEREAKLPARKRMTQTEVAQEARTGQRVAQIAVFDPGKAQKFANLQQQIIQNQKKFTEEAERSRSSIGQMLNDFGRIAKFSILAGVVVRGFFAIEQAISGIVTGGIEFNSRMQEGVASFAGLLAVQNDVVDAQGKLVTGVERGLFLFEQAKKVQEDVRIIARESTANYEEAEGAMRQILIHGQGQKSTEAERLQLAKNLLDMSIAAGQRGDKAEVNVRQILEAELKRGNLFLSTLGISLKQTQEWKKQGILIQEIGKRAEIFAEGMRTVGERFEIARSTAVDFNSEMAAMVGQDLFLGLTQILKGFNEEMKKILAGGGLAQALDLKPEELQKIGADLARISVEVAKLVISFTNLFIKITEFVGVERVFKTLAYIIGTLLVIALAAAAQWVGVLVIAMGGRLLSAISLAGDAILLFNIYMTASPWGVFIVGAAAAAAAIYGIYRAYQWLTGGAEAAAAAAAKARNTGALIGAAAVLPAGSGLSLKPKPVADVGADADTKAMNAAAKAARQYADSLEKLRSLQTQVAEARAAAFHVADMEAVKLRQIAEIEAELAEDRERYAGNAKAIRNAELAAIEKLKLAEIERTQLSIRLANERNDLQLDELRATQNFIEAQNNLTQTKRDVAVSGAEQDLEDLEHQRASIDKIAVATANLIKLRQLAARQQVINAEQELQAARVMIQAIADQVAAAAEAVRQAQSANLSETSIKNLADAHRNVALQQMDAAGRVYDAQGNLIERQQDFNVEVRKGAREWDNVGKHVVRTSDIMWDSFGQALKDMRDGTLDIGETFEQLGKDIDGAFIDAFTEALKEKFKFDTEIKLNTEQISQQFDATGTNINTSMTGGLQQAGSAATGLTSTVQTQTSLMSQAFGALGSFVSNIFGGIGSGLSSIMSGISRLFGMSGGGGGGFLSGLFGGGGGGGGGGGFLSGLFGGGGGGGGGGFLSSLFGGGGGGFLSGLFGGGAAASSGAGSFFKAAGAAGQNPLAPFTGGGITGGFKSLGGGGGLSAAFKAYGQLQGVLNIGKSIFGKGNSTQRAISGALAAASLIPGPQQPFVMIASQLFNMFGGKLFKPGRIKMEKTTITKFLTEQFKELDMKFKIVPEKIGAKGLFNFKDINNALLALGTKFAAGAKGATAGTVKRFAAQTAGNFEKMNMSTKEAEENVKKLAEAMGTDLVENFAALDALINDGVLSIKDFEDNLESARRNLKKYGDTSNLTAEQLTQLALSNGNVGSTLVTLNKIIAGFIDIATEFNPLIDSVAIANALLADSFHETAKATGLFNAEVERIENEIRTGARSIEEGIIALNGLRAAAGLAKIELKDLELDATQIVAQIEMIKAVFEEIGRDAKSAIAEGITGGLGAVDVAKNFRKMFYKSLVDVILEGFIDGFLRAATATGPLAAALIKIAKLIQDYISGAIGQNEYITGITGALGEVKPLIERIAEAIGIASDQFTEMLRAAGILPEILDDAADAGKDLAKSLRDAARELLLDTRLSPLKPRERVAEAQTEFEMLRKKAMAGDKEAAAQLPEAARRYLEEARNVFASSAAYEAIFDFVRQTLLDVADKFGAAEDVGERQLRTLEEIRDELRKLTTGVGPNNLNAPIERPPALATGGIATRPTYALLGERGPEAVIPLSHIRNMLPPLMSPSSPSDTPWWANGRRGEEGVVAPGRTSDYDNTSELVSEMRGMRAEMASRQSNNGQNVSVNVNGQVILDGKVVGAFVEKKVQYGLSRRAIRVPSRTVSQRN